MGSDGDLWVFGYGSLLWHPGFAHVETALARVEGWHRSFCMWSIHHRGKPERPGLVLALDAAPGAHCDGLAFRVPAAAREETLAYLRERELISSAYVETTVAVTLGDGRKVEAVTYVIDPAHEQHTGGLTFAEQAQVIARAVGGRGPNPDYLFNTARHLAELGIEDDDLTRLADEVRAILGAARAQE